MNGDIHGAAFDVAIDMPVAAAVQLLGLQHRGTR